MLKGGGAQNPKPLSTSGSFSKLLNAEEDLKKIELEMKGFALHRLGPKGSSSSMSNRLFHACLE
jgi:hypothetical protein